METIISILIVTLIFCILYIRVLIKENKQLLNEICKCEKLVPELEEALHLQKNLTKVFENGYDNLKTKCN